MYRVTRLNVDERDLFCFLLHLIVSPQSTLPAVSSQGRHFDFANRQISAGKLVHIAHKQDDQYHKR